MRLSIMPSDSERDEEMIKRDTVNIADEDEEDGNPYAEGSSNRMGRGDSVVGNQI